MGDPNDFAARVAAAMQSNDQQGAANPFAIDAPQVDQAVLDKYSESRPVIESVVANMINQHFAPKLHDLDTRAQQVTSTVEQRVADSSDGMYRSMVRSQHQDLDTIVQTPEFTQFKNTPVPYTGGKTVADLLHEAHSTKNATAVVSLINDFKANAGAASQPAQPIQSNSFSPQVASYAQPHTAPNAALYPQATMQQYSTPGAQAMPGAAELNWDQYRNLSAAFTTGQVTREQYAAMAAPFEQAIMQADQMGIPLDQLVGPM